MTRWIARSRSVWALMGAVIGAGACGGPAKKSPDLASVDVVDAEGEIIRDGVAVDERPGDPEADPSMGILKRSKTKRDSKFVELLGAYQFGMSVPQVRAAITKQIKERYDGEIRKAEDVFSADKLRERRKMEIADLKHVPFKGQQMGWNSSLIDDQFRHKLDESMMVYWENYQGKDQRRFFFFYRGRLYKMAIALNTKAIAGGAQLDFAKFRQLLERTYGPSKSVESKNDDGETVVMRADWESPLYSIRALDKLPIYGSFALVIASRSHESRVAANRARNPTAAKGRNNITDAIRERDGDVPNIDDNSDAVDKLIKKD